MHMANSDPTAGSQSEMLVPCALSFLPCLQASTLMYQLTEIIEGGCREGKPWPLVPSVSGAEILSRQWMGPVLSSARYCGLRNVQTHFSPAQPPRKDVTIICSSCWEEYKQFAGGGKEGRNGGNPGCVA